MTKTTANNLSRMRRGATFLLLALAASVVSPTVSAEERVVRITNGDWPPYLGESLPEHGTASSVITRAFKQMGYKVEYGFFPWTRSLTLVERKEWDAAAVWRKTPEREVTFYFSDPVMTEKFSLFYLKDSPTQFNSLADLKGNYVGIARSYYYGPEFNKLMKASEFMAVETESELLLLKNILAKRLAVAPLFRDVGLHLIKTQLTADEQKQIAVSTFTFEEAPLYLLFAKIPENKELVAKFNQGLKRAQGKPAAR